MYQRSIGLDTAELVVSTGEAVGAILNGTSFLARAVSLAPGNATSAKEAEFGRINPEASISSYGFSPERGG